MKPINKWGFEWYPINDKDLMLKDVMDKETVNKVFPKWLIENENRVVYAPNNINKWEDSAIREYLNKNFINLLDKEELELNGDYVRLITKEEVENLINDIVKCNTSYWTLSPQADLASFVYHVTSGGNLNNFHAFSTYGVRPIVRLKNKIDNKLPSKINITRQDNKKYIEYENIIGHNKYTIRVVDEYLANKINKIIDYLKEREDKDK